MVAVMFASLKNFEMTLPNLRVLNEIISEFDQIVRPLKYVFYLQFLIFLV